MLTLAVVDTCIHFVDRRRVRYAWLVDAEKAEKLAPGTLDREWLPPDLYPVVAKPPPARRAAGGGADAAPAIAFELNVGGGVLVESCARDDVEALKEAKWALHELIPAERQRAARGAPGAPLVDAAVLRVPVPRGGVAVRAFLAAIAAGPRGCLQALRGG